MIITNDKKLAFVDFGIVGHFDENLKNKSIDLFLGIIENDTQKVTDTLIELSDVEIENKDELMIDIGNVLGSLQESDVSKVKVSYSLEEIMDLALSYGLKIPMPFVLFGKTIITLEGIALEYDPKFDIIESSKPFIEQLVRQRYNPVKVLNNFMKSMIRFKKISEELPEQASRALKKAYRKTRRTRSPLTL